MKYSTFNPTPYETHMLVYNRIEQGSDVLDVGCASGYFAKKLKEKSCKVWGIEADRESAEMAKKYCREVFVADLEKISIASTIRGVPSTSFGTGMASQVQPATSEVSFLSLPLKKKFDYILLLDVIEHIKNPEKVISLLKPLLKKGGKMIISTPNIAFISIRLALFFGRFEYQKMGIMDENHIRFYTKKTFLQLIKECGLKIEEFVTASGFSQISKIGKYLNRIPKYWQYKITKIFDTLLGYQFIAICTPSPRGSPSGHPRGVFEALL